MPGQHVYPLLGILIAVICVQKVLGSIATSYNEVVGAEYMYRPSSQNELHVRHKRQEGNFRYMWVTQCGYSADKPTDTPSLEVAGTELVDAAIVDRAAKLVHLMVRFMSPILFKNMTETISVGIFSVTEYADSFPEYNHDNGEGSTCRTSCQESCESYCENGSPIALKWSHGGIRAVSNDGNVVCGQGGIYDPGQGTENMLVKRLGQSIFKYVLPQEALSELNDTYVNASNQALWSGIQNLDDYVGQSTLVWFQAMKSESTNIVAGSMNVCDDDLQCVGEWNHRENLRVKDPALYSWLNNIYNQGRSYLEGRISVCDF